MQDLAGHGFGLYSKSVESFKNPLCDTVNCIFGLLKHAGCWEGNLSEAQRAIGRSSDTQEIGMAWTRMVRAERGGNELFGRQDRRPCQALC